MIVAAAVVIGATAVGIYNATTKSNTDADSKAKEAITIPSPPTVIFRYGGTNPGNLFLLLEMLQLIPDCLFQQFLRRGRQ